MKQVHARVKGRVCFATVIHPAAPPEANAECKISCTPAPAVMLLRLTRAERAGACAGAVKPTAPNKAMQIRWHSAPSYATCKMRVISSQAMQRQAPGASQDVPQCAARQCRRACIHSTAHSLHCSESRCYQNGGQGPRRRLNKRQQLIQRSNALSRAPASNKKGAHTPGWQQACSAQCGSPTQTPLDSAACTAVTPPGGTGRPAVACPSRR